MLLRLLRVADAALPDMGAQVVDEHLRRLDADIRADQRGLEVFVQFLVNRRALEEGGEEVGSARFRERDLLLLLFFLLRAPEQAAENHGASLLGDRSVSWRPPFAARALIVAYWFAMRRRDVKEARAMRLAELTWPEARDAFAAGAVAILPVGATEAHGPHLPLDTDVHIAIGAADRTAALLAAEGTPALVLPPLAYGVSFVGTSFAGTLPVAVETMTARRARCADRIGSLWLHGGDHRQ